MIVSHKPFRNTRYMRKITDERVQSSFDLFDIILLYIHSAIILRSRADCWFLFRPEIIIVRYPGSSTNPIYCLAVLWLPRRDQCIIISSCILRYAYKDILCILHESKKKIVSSKIMFPFYPYGGPVIRYIHMMCVITSETQNGQCYFMWHDIA